ncbi:MAG: hypothetical protein J2P43_15350 [Candidatus Dormibacteraeota bacterium]|nr:hypothetical protein [Candidatus Dormibacteraeota bacterium]
MIGQRAQGRAGLGLTLLIVAGVWLLTGLRAYAAFSDAHNPRFVHVQATLSHCGQNGCEATFSLRDHTYTVTGVSGRDGERVTLYVEPGDPYVYAQAQSWIQAYGLFLLVVLLTLVGVAAWWFLRRRRTAHTSPEASRS